MVNGSKQSVLKNKDGEFVTVQKHKGGLKLCAVDRQKEFLVCIETRTKDEKNQVAFRFKREDGYYSPEVVGTNILKVNKIEITTELTNSHWFEKVNFHDGAYYRLKSVRYPTQYLCACPEGKNKIFRLHHKNPAELKDEDGGSSA